MKAPELKKWTTYFDARNTGLGVEAAARKARIASTTAWRFERNDPASTGLEAASILGISMVAGNLVDQPLSKEAIKALEDFAYFRLRYFGRKSTPWQERAAYEVIRQIEEAKATRQRRFVVMNEPPGSGKSTLFTHDITTWAIVRDRTIRVMIGSRTERQARMYVGRIKRSLERDVPLRADADSVAKKIAFDAEACLSDDFGMFKPEGRSDLWAANGLTVRQTAGTALDDKEPTVSAWGMDSGFLGGRFDLVIWDDLVDRKNTRTPEARDAIRDWWDSEAETRIEPGGVLLLQGQRISPDDLYRYCLDKQDDDERMMYHHVTFPAHHVDVCNEDHGVDARPWPDGCLIDPVRLPWKFLESRKRNNPKAFTLQYQQEDHYGTSGLVQDAWLTGGVDEDGYPAPGCYDNDRGLLDYPVNLSGGRAWSFVTVDPSPDNWWGIIWWLYDPDTSRRYVIDIHRRRLTPQEFLSLDLADFSFSGLMEEMRQQSNNIGIPISHVVVEVNAAQKWLLQQPHIQRWVDVTGVLFVPHQTGINKNDPKYGVESIGDYFRQGLIRLPRNGLTAKEKVADLVYELIRYPDGETTDLVMSTWFHTLAVQHHYTPRTNDGMYRLRRDRFVGTAQRGLPSWR